MNISVGFRMNFRKKQYDELEKIIKQYSALFEIYEVKVTDSFEKAEHVRSIINLSKKYLKDKFSLHLPKNILEDGEELKKCELLFQMLQDMKYDGNLVTHIPSDIDFEKYESILVKLSQIIPSNSILLLENIVVERSTEYLIKINKLFESLDKSGINNIKFCLDFGHLVFSFYKNDKSQGEALKELSDCINIMQNIKEIHLHDFNGELDHLHLGEGLLKLDNIVNFILTNGIRCPIIIETSISNPNEDGCEQIELVKQILLS